MALRRAAARVVCAAAGVLGGAQGGAAASCAASSLAAAAAVAPCCPSAGASTSYPIAPALAGWRLRQASPLARWSSAASAACLSQAALQQQPQPAAGATYTLHVYTGNLRGAGSVTPAWIQLVGSRGKSERLLIGETDEDSLERGTQRTVTITTSEDIGQVRFVHVQRLSSSITEAGTGWFLQQINVDTPCGKRLVFPCNAWFGESDAGGHNGPMERNLLPVADNVHEVGQPVRLSASGVAVPHPDKVKYDSIKGVNRKGFGHGGEDAYFYCQGENNMFAMGVADGVFMWREMGIDSGNFSRALMRVSEQSVQAGFSDVVKVMQTAAAHVREAGVQGSSTVCLAMVDQGAGQLYAANLGDSGLLLLRPSADNEFAIKFRTNQLEHDFGTPFQLGHHLTTDGVEHCDVVSLALRRDDVIVMGTDGLLDNLNDHEIAAEVVAGRMRGSGTSAIAQRLARLAFEASYDKHRTTPYALAASEHFDMVYSGRVGWGGAV